MRILLKLPVRAVPRLHLVPHWLDARRLELIAFPVFLLLLATTVPSHLALIAWNDQPAPPAPLTRHTPAWVHAASHPNLVMPAPPVLPARFYDLLTQLSSDGGPYRVVPGLDETTLQPLDKRIETRWTDGNPARQKALRRALRRMATEGHGR